jgi:aspartate/methionine/tyrosine aminotransferase
MKALLLPGSKVVAMTPSYQSLYELADSTGCTVQFWEPHMQEDGGMEYRVQDVVVSK